MYENRSKEAMSGFLKTKVSALHDSIKIKNGRNYVESIIGRNISLDNIRKYETKYRNNRRYLEGYEAERNHVKTLIDRYNEA